MESAAQLRLRIEELSTAIEAQKQVLEDLENTRFKARRDLNSICDPMERLPLEISSGIFMLCVIRSDMPAFLNVCHLWRTIALSTPRFWAELDINIYPFRHAQDSFTKLCNTWLGRAQTLPLSLSIEGPINQCVQDLVKRYRHQVQDITMEMDPDDDFQWFEGPFPSLKRLNLSNAPWDTENPDSPEMHVEMLRGAPKLLECRFRDFWYYSSDESDADEDEDENEDEDEGIEPLRHTSLRDLRLGRPKERAADECSSNGAKLLKYLTLPALERLDIACLDIPSEAFKAFLTRSSPPLQSLHIVIPPGAGYSSWGCQTLTKYFQLMPGLTELDVLCPGDLESSLVDDPLDGDPFHTFLHVLQTTDNFLPKLRDLTLQPHDSRATDYGHLIRALTARLVSRHTPLRSFRFIFNPESYHGPLEQAPDEHIVLALQDFVDAGMHIHIGPLNHNYVNSIPSI
ncbi:hypothetical protein DFH06DRAFT_769044 [Mycena polygramma]|nr:hypothetical protein DFH06DRAFT_769044 [Mycena polygramma]